MRYGQTRRGFLRWGAAVAVGGTSLVTLGDDTKPTKAEEKAGATTRANDRLNVAIVGAGGQGRHDMKQVLSLKQNVVAVCDVDENAIAQALKEGGEPMAKAKTYTDYRRLLEREKSIDAVIVATPDHWHAPLCEAFIRAGKHVYCEKPLTRTIGEARRLRGLARANPKVVTQTGNQASAESSLKRSVELIRAGVLGQVREVHAWLSNGGPGRDRPEGEDPIPAGMNWDLWCGPSPYRAHKSKVYHPGAWRGWLDFGTGPIGDFTCHIFNTALRSLELTHPTKVAVAGEGLAKDGWAKWTRMRMHYPARQGAEPARSLDPVVVYWYDGGQRPGDELLVDVFAAYKDPPKHGCLIVGEKGIIYTNPWNASAAIKLRDDAKLKDILRHEPTKDVAATLPRGIGHMEEWVRACKGQGKTWSDFDFGGRLTEIGLTGVLATRVGRDIAWDGEKIKADAPEADKFIHAPHRRAWLV